MKRLLFLILLFLSVGLYAQSKNPTKYTSQNIANFTYDEATSAMEVKITSATVGLRISNTDFPLPASQVNSLKNVWITSGSVNVINTPNVNSWQAGFWDINSVYSVLEASAHIKNFPSDYPDSISQATLNSINSKINIVNTKDVAITSGSVSVNNFPSTQITADERYTAKVSTYSAGRLTSSDSVSVNYSVVKFSFLSKGGESEVTTSAGDGIIYLPDNIGTEIIFDIPKSGFSLSATLSTNTTLYYTIIGVK